MGLKGNLAEVSLTEIFQTISQDQLSGLLRIQAPQGSRLVEIVDGAISIVANASNRIPIGELLLARGLISEPQLKMALAQQRQTGELLGKTLIGANMVTHEHIEAAVRFQIEEEISDLILLEEADFDFLPDATLDASMALAGGLVRLQEDPNSLLVEAGKRAEDWKEILKKIPNQAMVFQLKTTGEEFVSSGEGLSPEGMILLRLIQNHRSVEAMVQKACLGRINTNSMLIELWEAGLLAPLSTNVYAGVAQTHFEDGRDGEAKRVAIYALSFQCSEADRKTLQGILNEIQGKEKGASGAAGSDPLRVRSEVIRRQPSLVVRSKPTLAPYIIGGIIFLVLAGGGGAYYFLNVKGGAGSDSEFLQVQHLVVRAEEHMENKKYEKALAEFNYTLKSDRATKLRDKKYELIKERIFSSAGAFLNRFRKAMDVKNEDDMPAFQKEFALYEGVPFEKTLRESMQEAGAAIREWELRMQEERFDADLKAILAKAGGDDQIDELYAFLNKHPSEKMAFEARVRIAQLADQRRLAVLDFEAGKTLQKMGVLTYARQKFDLVLQRFPGSKQAQEAAIRVKKIGEAIAISTATLGEINNLILREDYDPARKKLIEFLSGKVDSQTAKAARLMLHRMAPGKEDKAAEQLRVVAEGLAGAGKTDEARTKYLELAKTYGYTRVASNVKFSVTLTSHPSGAGIWVDGVKTEKRTPAKLQLSMVDVVRVSLRLNGFMDSDIPLRAEGGDTSLLVLLTKTPVHFPMLMPMPASLGMTVKDHHVALLGKNEVAFWLRTKRGGKPLSRPRFRKEATHPNIEVSKWLPSFHSPLYLLSSKLEEIELLVPTEKAHVWRINPIDGKARSLVLASAPISRPVPIFFTNITDGLFIGIATRAGFECIDLLDGQPRFPALVLGDKAGDQLVSIAYDRKSNLVFVPRPDGKLYAIDSKAGEVSWTVELPKDRLGSPVLRPGISQLAVATKSGKIVLWDIAERGQKSKTLDMKEPCGRGLMAAANGLVIVSESKKIGFLNSTATVPLWTEAFTKDISLGPIEVGKFLVTTMGSELLLIETTRSVVVWRMPMPSKPVALAAEGSQFYVSTEDSFLWEFKAE